jgi:hypothetical protein
VNALTAGLVDLGRQISGNIDKAAHILSDLKVGGVGFATWRNTIASRDWSIVAATPDILVEQRAEADTLYRHGYIPRSIVPVAAASPQALAETIEAGAN